MKNEEGSKKGCKKARRSSHLIRRHRSKGKGRDAFALLSRFERILARSIKSIPNGRMLDRMADQGKWWDLETRLFLRPKIQHIMES